MYEIIYEMARGAGVNLYESSRKNSNVVGVFSMELGNVTVPWVGVSPKGAKECDFDVVIGDAEAADRHPGGMVCMSKIWIGLVFNKVNGELVGGCIRGGPSAGELINSISAWIQNLMRAPNIAIFQIEHIPQS